MRRQRFAYTLPAGSSNDLVVQETDDASSMLTNPYAFQPPMWSEIPPDVETMMSCYMFQCPVIQMPSDCSSCTTIVDPSCLVMTPYDSSTDFYASQIIEQPDFSTTSLVADSGYGDAVIPAENLPAEVPFCDLTELELPPDMPSSFPMVTNYGAVTILLRHLIRVDIAPDKSVYVTNSPSEAVAVANGMGNKSCVVHPNGKVFHDNDEIHMSTLNRKAKVSRRGVVFTSTDHCLSYLVDASGTKTTAEKFRDLNMDFSYQVFYSEAASESSFDQCQKMVEEAVHRTYKNGDEVWIIGGLRVKQDQWGDVKVSRNYGRRVIKASPTNGQMYVKTDGVEIMVSRYPNNYFVVKKGNHLVSASLKGFTVQCGTQKAGFNNVGRLVLK